MRGSAKTLKLKFRKFKYRLDRNKPICKFGSEGEFYYPLFSTLNLACRGSTDDYCLNAIYPIKLIRKEATYDIKVFVDSMYNWKPKSTKKMVIQSVNPKDVAIDAPYFLATADSFQRTIEYAGKSGETLKFVYAEFENDFARPAFSREFQIDLNEGNVGAYKGAVFEIQEATNATIKYSVIRHFQ